MNKDVSNAIHPIMMLRGVFEAGNENAKLMTKR